MNEPPIHDELGNFSQVHIPVRHTGGNGYFSTNEPDYLYPQKQDEHDELLNTFYEQRVQYPNWKEMGYEVEVGVVGGGKLQPVGNGIRYDPGGEYRGSFAARLSELALYRLALVY